MWVELSWPYTIYMMNSPLLYMMIVSSFIGLNFDLEGMNMEKEMYQYVKV